MGAHDEAPHAPHCASCGAPLTRPTEHHAWLRCGACGHENPAWSEEGGAEALAATRAALRRVASDERWAEQQRRAAALPKLPIAVVLGGPFVLGGLGEVLPWWGMVAAIAGYVLVVALLVRRLRDPALGTPEIAERLACPNCGGLCSYRAGEAQARCGFCGGALVPRLPHLERAHAATQARADAAEHARRCEAWRLAARLQRRGGAEDLAPFLVFGLLIGLVDVGVVVALAATAIGARRPDWSGLLPMVGIGGVSTWILAWAWRRRTERRRAWQREVAALARQFGATWSSGQEDGLARAAEWLCGRWRGPHAELWSGRAFVAFAAPLGAAELLVIGELAPESAAGHGAYLVALVAGAACDERWLAGQVAARRLHALGFAVTGGPAGLRVQAGMALLERGGRGLAWVAPALGHVLELAGAAFEAGAARSG